MCLGLDGDLFTEDLHQELQMTFQKLNYTISVLAEFTNRSFDYACLEVIATTGFVFLSQHPSPSGESAEECLMTGLSPKHVG